MKGDTLSNLTGAAAAPVVTQSRHPNQSSHRNRKHGRGANEELPSIGEDGDSPLARTNDVDEPAEEHPFLKSLQLNAMKESWNEESDEYLRVASLEIAAKEAHQEKTLPSTADHPPQRMGMANDKIRQLGGKILNRDEYLALTSISKGDLGGRI
jgi:hypothetical protein